MKDTNDIQTIDALTNEQITPEMNQAIDLEKAEKKFIFQFISHGNGGRSEPFIANWTDLHNILSDGTPDMKDYILLVAVLDAEETIIPGTPLITIGTFMDFKTNGAQANG